MSYPPPLYTSDSGEVSAWLRPAWEVPDLESVNTQVHYLATGATTGGLFGLYRYEMSAARSGPDPHFHRTMSSRSSSCPARCASMTAPAGATSRRVTSRTCRPAASTGSATSPASPSRCSCTSRPGRRESYFEAVAAVARGERSLTAEEWTKLYRQHDQYMV